MRLAAIGLAIGISGALAVAPVFAGQVSAVRPFEPVAYVAAAVLVTLTVSVASWRPSHRAARVDPAVTLRCD